MLETLLINLLSSGVTTGLKIGRDKLEETALQKEFSEDIDIIATQFNRSLKTEVVATAEAIDGLDATQLERRWGGIAESLGDLEAVYFESEEDAVARISDAIVDELELAEDQNGIEPDIQQAVAESYSEAVDEFHDRVSGTELASQLGLESAEVLRDELREVQVRLSDLQKELQQRQYYRLYDQEAAEQAVEMVADWFPNIPYFEYRENSVPTVTGHDRLVFTGIKGVGKTRHLVRTIRERDDYDQVLVPTAGIERASDLDPVADRVEGDLLLVWDDIHEVSRTRETWLFQAAVQRLENIVAERGHSLIVAATAREDALGELPGSLDNPEGFWQTFQRERIPRLSQTDATQGWVIKHLLDYYEVNTSEIRATTEAMQRLQNGRYDAEFLYLVVAYRSEFESPIPERELPVGAHRIWAHRYEGLEDSSSKKRLVLEAVAIVDRLGLDPYYPLVGGVYREVYGQNTIQDRFRPHLEDLLNQGWFDIVLEEDSSSTDALPESDDTLETTVIQLPKQQRVVPAPPERTLEAVSEFLLTNLDAYLPAVDADGTIQTLDIVDGQMPLTYEPVFPVWCHHQYLQYLSEEAPDLYEAVRAKHIEAMVDTAADPHRIRAIHGRKLWLAGERAAAMEYFQPVVEEGRADTYPTAFGLYGINLWTESGDTKGTDYLYEAVKPQELDTPTRPHTLEVNVYVYCGDHLRRTGDLELALDVYQRARHLGASNDPIVEAKIAKTLAAIGRYEEARNRLEAAIDRHPESVELQGTYGRLLCQKGDYADAIPLLKGAASAAPEPTRLFYLLAEAHEEIGDLSEAEQWFERGRGQQSEHVDGRLSYIRFLLEQDRRETVRDVIEEGLDSPQIRSVSFATAVADTCAANNAPELAIEYLIPPARSAFHADKTMQGAKLTRKILEIAYDHERWGLYDEWHERGLRFTQADSRSRGEVLNGAILREADKWWTDRGSERALVRTAFADRHIIHGQYRTAIPLLTAIWDDAHLTDEIAFENLYRLNAGPMLAALAVLTDSVEVDPEAIAMALDGETHRLRKETRTLLKAVMGENTDRSPEDMVTESDLTHEDVEPIAPPSDRDEQSDGDIRRLACAELLHQVRWQRRHE
jgi:tetratricopeptide (TPR) repeat protein